MTSLQNKKVMPVNVLCVDDTPANLVALTAILDQPEYTVLSADSGQAALDILKKEDVAVILLDVQMPDMDGFETAKIINSNKLTKHIPIIFLTAISKDEKFVCYGYQSGAVDYMRKPFESNILKSKVQVFADMFRQNKELKDLTMTLKRLMEELQRSNTELNQFAGVLGHDLKEPLNKSLFYCSEIKETLEKTGDKQAISDLSSIEQSMTRMKRFLNDLLMLSSVNTRKKNS